IELTINEFTNPTVPTLIFTNYDYIDENANRMNLKSKFKIKSFGNFLIQNIGLGCTIMFNHSLLEYLYKIDIPENYMHDALMVRLAATFGEIKHLREFTMAYRQHSNNVIGGKKKSLVKQKSNSLKRALNKSYSKRITGLYKCINKIPISQEKTRIINLAIDYKKSFTKWIKLFFSLEYVMQGFIDTVALKLLILLRKF